MRPIDAGRLAVLSAAVTGLVALSTLATGCKSRTQRIEDDISKSFKEIDLDQDGRLSRGEYTTSRLGKLGAENKVSYDRLDANNDDAVTPEEIKQVIDARKAKPEKPQPKPKQEPKQ